MTSITLGGANTIAFTIANRHLFVGDTVNSTAVIIWDAQTDQDGLDQVILSNGTFTRAQIEAALVGVPNFSWAELTISEAEVNEGIANVQTIIGGDDGPTVDIVSGGTNGNDTLYAATGDDVLIGGGGDDLFVFGDGDDTITDFTAGASTDDVIGLAGVTAVNSFQDVQDNASQVGGDTVIDLGGGDSVSLIGVNLVDLHQDDFLF